MSSVKLDWVGKYFIGALGLYAVTAPLRNRKRSERTEIEVKFLHAFKNFSVSEAIEFLTSQKFSPEQIPCFFEHSDGQISMFIYEPGAPEKLAQWQLDVLTKFINLYGMKELKPALELSRDGARDEAICFLWNEKSDSSHIDQVTRALRLLNEI